MEKLSKENIQFIENYLENSDILYADIRMEMTDHVASAIESQMHSGDDRGFYLIFKDYMIAHKSKLLKNNKKFIENADMSILRQIGKQLIKPLTIGFFLLSFLTIYKALNYIEIEQLRSIIFLFPILSIVPFCIIYGLLIKWFKLSRFSGIERMGFIQMMMFQLYNCIITMLGIHVKTSANYIVVALSLALVFTVFAVMIKLTLSVIKQYRIEYKNLA